MGRALPRRLHSGPFAPRTVPDLLARFTHAGLETGRLRNPKQAASRVRAMAEISCDLADLTPAAIAEFFADFERGPSRRGGPRSPNTVELHAAILRQALTWAVEQGWLDSSPFPVRLSIAAERSCMDPLERDQNRLTGEEAGRLLSDSRIPGMRRAIYSAALYAGPRPGELLELRVGDLRTDNDGGRYWLIARQWQGYEGEVRSTKTRVARAVPMHPAALAAIDAHLAHWWPRKFGRPPAADDLVFASPKFNRVDHMNIRTLNRWLKKDLALVGAKPRTFHALRASFISRLVVDLEQPALLVEWLTHRTASIQQGGPVVGGYTRGVYGRARKMICDVLAYPMANQAQLGFAF